MSERPSFWEDLAESNEEKKLLFKVWRRVETMKPYCKWSKRQRQYHEQIGGPLPDHPGCFCFILEPVVDRGSQLLGVHERIFWTHVRLQGLFLQCQRLDHALVQGATPQPREHGRSGPSVFYNFIQSVAQCLQWLGTYRL